TMLNPTPNPTSERAMRVSLANLLIVIFFVSLSVADWVRGQGSLDPTGAPEELFKTLEQIEPRTIIDSLPITITQPGSYYLIKDLTKTTVNGDGITIDANEVDIDLNGFAIYGGNFSGIASDDGIFILGSQTNIHIYNGTVAGWDGDGINALNADFSIFENLRVSQNDGDGLVTDFNCLIVQCTAFSNGFDGLEGDDGTVIKTSTAGQNGDNGIQTSEGCTVVDCASFDNETDGFDIGAGSVINGCSATDNGIFGFDIALGSQAIQCTAHDNISNGFDMASACILRDSIASLNGGHGVRVFANSYVTHCKFHENDLDGMRISSTDCHISDNQTTDNDQTGIAATSSGSFIVRNTCSGNVTNYNIDPNCSFGPIVDITNAGDLTSVSNSVHPLANFTY
ncbi:MAG: right-handed parallel beta-helix repeat-containing protein, partial [Verrucomicrobiota bacterium]